MKQDISDIYVADKAITKSNNNINKTTNDEKSIRSKNFKPILLYSLVGGGFIFITATGLFALRRLMHISGVNNREEVQLDSFRGGTFIYINIFNILLQKTLLNFYIYV